GGSPWSEEPLDLSALRAQDADIDLTAQSLIMPDQQIDDLVAKITVRNGIATMQTLQGKIYGGGFNLSGTTVDASTPTTKLDAKVAVNQIQVGQVGGGRVAGKQVQGITSGVNGILSSYTGVDNKVDGTFDIKQGVLNTQDFAFVNPKARGTAKGDFDIGGWAMNMLIALFGQDAQEAFMSIGLNGPMTPTPTFASNGAAGATGLIGLSQQGVVNPPGVAPDTA